MSNLPLSINPLDDEIIALIWRRMIVLYDHKWTSKLGFGIDGEGFLTEAATVWAEELSDVSRDDLTHGFSSLRTAFPEWPPSVLEFRMLCLSKMAANIPTLDEVVSILVTVSARNGSLVDRFQHSLAFAVSHKVDMHGLRVAKTIDAKRMIKPAYERLVSSGWDEFPEHAYENQGALTHQLPEPNKAIGISAFKNIRSSL